MGAETETITEEAASAVTPEDIAGLQKKLAEVSDDVKNYAEDVAKVHAAGNEMAKGLREDVDKALASQGELREAIRQIELHHGTMGTGAHVAQNLTPGQRFVESDEVKKFMQDRSQHGRGRVRVDMAAVTTLSDAAGGVLVKEERIDGIVKLPERRMTVRDLLTSGRTSTNAIEYVKESGFTNNAAPVSEATTKPESNMTFELVTRPVRTIAHWLLASKQILDDAPMLESHIDGRLRYGLAYVEEDQLLNGDNDAANLYGLIPQATAYSAAFTPTAIQALDKVRLAILQSELAEFPATGIVMNPTDWARVELTKDGNERYIIGNPQGAIASTLWRRPVVATQAMTVDKFLTGAFRLGAQVFDREDAAVEVSTEDSDNFRKNLVTIRAEERLVLAVYRPEAFIYGDFGYVT